MEKAFLSTNICLVEIENSSFLVKMGNINTYSKLEIDTNSISGYPTIVNWGLRAGNSEKYVESSIIKNIFFPTSAYLLYNIGGWNTAVNELPYFYLENYNSIHDQFNIIIRLYRIA